MANRECKQSRSLDVFLQLAKHLEPRMSSSLPLIRCHLLKLAAWNPVKADLPIHWVLPRQQQYHSSQGHNQCPLHHPSLTMKAVFQIDSFDSFVPLMSYWSPRLIQATRMWKKIRSQTKRHIMFKPVRSRQLALQVKTAQMHGLPTRFVFPNSGMRLLKEELQRVDFALFTIEPVPLMKNSANRSTLTKFASSGIPARLPCL